MITFDIDTKFRDSLLTLQQRVYSVMEQEIVRIQSDVDSSLQASLALNIYSTAAGNFYKRTGRLAMQTKSKASAQKTQFKVVINSTVRYASVVEDGTEEGRINRNGLLRLSLDNRGLPFSLGRTGQRFTVPGPFVISATVLAYFKLQEAFYKTLKVEWDRK